MDDKVRLELSEQEAKHLLKLIGEELERTEKVWAPYWLKIMSSLQAALNRAGYSSEPYQEKGK
ncbi:MAG: hypothetical protein OES12_08250 [Anaerolineae bacterium]|jgi:hypothetical protein|nr:hypothetical protein [Anaerolineae bacterium]